MTENRRMEARKLLQILVVFVLSFTMMFFLLISLPVRYTVLLVAGGYLLTWAIARAAGHQGAENVLKRIRHWFVEALDHTWVFTKTVAVKRHMFGGKEFAIGWPLGIVLALTVVAWNAYWLTQATPVTTATVNVLVFLPIGVERIGMSKEMRDLRAQKMIQTRRFYLLREDGAELGAKKVTGDAYRTAIAGASKFYGIEADILEAHVFLESMGSEQAKSPTGPKGPGQFTALTAANLWDVKDGRYLLRYKGQEKDVTAKHRRTTLIRSDEIIEDNREDIELSVYAEAKLLREEKDFFGRQDFASAAYHSSRNKIRNWIMKYLEPRAVTNGGKKDIEAYGLDYDTLYFGSTPYTNPGTYQMFRDLMAEDFGANYWYKILCAKDLLAMYRSNPMLFHDLAEKQRYNGKRAQNRMWTFFDPSDEPNADVSDLKKRLVSGQLVRIENKPEFGFTLRLVGPDSIGYLDLNHQDLYLATKKQTAGALLYIAQEVAKLRKGKTALPMEVTSMTRSIEYQKMLTKNNPVATKQLSFHVLSLAFDITKTGMTENDQRDIQFILDELDSMGYISWVPENKAYHIVVAPDPEGIAFFQKVYDSTTSYQVTSPLPIL